MHGRNQHETKRPVRPCECGDHYFQNLTRGYVALFSPSDAAFVGRWSWSALVLPDTRVRAVRRSNTEKRTYYMHVEMLRPTGGLVVDHINGNGIDNRRANLRIATQAQNTHNTRKQRRKRDGAPKGVHYDKARDKYQAYVNLDGVRVRLGRFDTAEEAAAARNAKARELHGEFFNPG